MTQVAERSEAKYSPYPPAEVLIINDDPDQLLQSFLEIMLSSEGISVQTTKQDEDILETVKKWSPKVILCNFKYDLGEEELRLLKQNFEGISIIRLADEPRSLKPIHQIRVFPKPFDIEELLKDIRTRII